ncbi:MAG: M15 family metallopeptidase [Defluviitaleaceae bacterium]|nr:M15 family metallopeptidase [Defluviitaleaceae bacterium]
MKAKTKRKRVIQDIASFLFLTSLIYIAWAAIALMVLEDTPAMMYISNDVDVAPVDSERLWLVNTDNPLTPDYRPKDLFSHNGLYIQAFAHTAFGEMLIAMNLDGITNLELVSAYRPYDYQQGLFSAKVRLLMSQGHSLAEATDLAAQVVQPPGASEHQTGLALDVTVAGDLTQAFAETKAGEWLSQNSHRFGFIIRYPQTKTDITHIIYEPWHLRYVGIPHAQIMYENNLTLEEYGAFIENTPFILWAEPKERRVFYIVVYSQEWPEYFPENFFDISSVNPGEGVGYIVTLRGVYITY